MDTMIIPGDVKNFGIKDDSRLPTIPKLATYPATFPVLSVVTPKGPLGQKYIDIGDFTDLYGDIFDIDSPYYNPISALISLMASAGQASIGVRRLTGNQEKARLIVGIKVYKGKVKQYERLPNGQFKLDAESKRIPVTVGETEVDGIVYEPVLMKPADGPFGKVPVSESDDGTAIGPVTTYPLFELQTKVGDVYNRSGLMVGVPLTSDFADIGNFVKANGVFPYTFKMYEKTSAGVPVFAKTLTNTDNTQFTLFPVKDRYDVRYSLENALGNYTGTNANRPVTPREAPFDTTFVYQDNVDLLARMFYEAESEIKPENLVYIEGKQPYRQMNLLTGTTHEGVPYYAIEQAGNSQLFNVNSALDATGGVSPFLTKDLKPFVDVQGTYNFDPAKGIVDELNRKDAWTISQALILADIKEYRKSLEARDWVRNRQSIIIDVGYNSEIKDELVELLNVRKDQIALFQASEWLEENTIEQRYSIANGLSTKLRLKPESERYGTPSCRSTIVMWDGKINNEASGEQFGLVLDLAHKFSAFGGNAAGTLLSVMSPDHEDNRHLTVMHSPTVELEEDENAANNFQIGATTVRPYDRGGVFYRPALPTVYPYDDSVLKDLITTFTSICCEKVIADTFPLVSGDSTIGDELVASTVKDRSEQECRQRFGTMFRNIWVDAGYPETGANVRSVLETTAYVDFNKGKYMMNLSLVARNAADQQAS